MSKCQHWEAVRGISLYVTQSSRFVGYYTVSVLHSHAGTDAVVHDEYDALSWGEASSTVESVLEANRPGFRHAHLQALQDRLWPVE